MNLHIFSLLAAMPFEVFAYAARVIQDMPDIIPQPPEDPTSVPAILWWLAILALSFGMWVFWLRERDANRANARASKSHAETIQQRDATINDLRQTVAHLRERLLTADQRYEGVVGRAHEDTLKGQERVLGAVEVMRGLRDVINELPSLMQRLQDGDERLQRFVRDEMGTDIRRLREMMEELSRRLDAPTPRKRSPP